MKCRCGCKVTRKRKPKRREPGKAYKCQGGFIPPAHGSFQVRYWPRRS